MFQLINGVQETNEINVVIMALISERDKSNKKVE